MAHNDRVAKDDYVSLLALSIEYPFNLLSTFFVVTQEVIKFGGEQEIKAKLIFSVDWSDPLFDGSFEAFNLF